MTPIKLENKSKYSKALFGIIQCDNSKMMERLNKKVKLFKKFLPLINLTVNPKVDRQTKTIKWLIDVPIGLDIKSGC